MKVGRPSKYEPDFCKQADKYLAKNQDENNVIGGVQHFNVNLPTVEGFALFLKVSKSTLYQWAKKYKKFSYALEKINTEQKTKLINNGLASQYNSTITKLMLVSNHGMSDKLMSEHSGEINHVLVEVKDTGQWNDN